MSFRLSCNPIGARKHMHRRHKRIENAEVGESFRIDTQPGNCRVALQELVFADQSGDQKCVPVLGVVTERGRHGPGQVLMSVAEHREFPIQPCGNGLFVFREQKIAATKITVHHRNVIERWRIGA